MLTNIMMYRDDGTRFYLTLGAVQTAQTLSITSAHTESRGAA